MEKKTYSKIDPETGEVLEVHSVVIGKVGKAEQDADFLKVYPAFFASFLQELKIDDGKARLVLYLMFKASKMAANGDNVIFAPNEDLMNELNISKPTLLRYIADLCNLNVIKRVKPKMPIYEINPNMIYKGTLSKYYKNLHKERFSQEPSEE